MQMKPVDGVPIICVESEDSEVTKEKTKIAGRRKNDIDDDEYDNPF